MESLLGLLRVRIIKGVNLAFRDTRGSDPYIILRLGGQQRGRVVQGVGRGFIYGVRVVDLASCGQDAQLAMVIAQKLKTSIIKNNVNPEWNEDLTLSVSEPLETIKLQVYDKDTFNRDDEMGDAEFDIQPYLKAVRMDLTGVPNGALITTVKPSRENCLAVESPISKKDGKVIQDLVLRLRNVESGEVELQLSWVNIPGAPGF